MIDRSASLPLGKYLIADIVENDVVFIRSRTCRDGDSSPDDYRGQFIQSVLHLKGRGIPRERNGRVNDRCQRIREVGEAQYEFAAGLARNHTQIDSLNFRNESGAHDGRLIAGAHKCDVKHARTCSRHRHPASVDDRLQRIQCSVNGCCIGVGRQCSRSPGRRRDFTKEIQLKLPIGCSCNDAEVEMLHFGNRQGAFDLF